MLRRSADARSERLRRYWDKQAPKYDKQVAFLERWLVGDGRHWVCSQATGDVLEVAIGTGRNLPFYPGSIRLTGTDFSPAMLELARRQADQLGRRVDLRLGDAQALELPDASFDTVVCTLSLCAIPDSGARWLDEAVAAPGGRLLCWTTWPACRGGCGPSSGCWSWSRGGHRRHQLRPRCCRCGPRAWRSNGGSGPSLGWWSGWPPASPLRMAGGREPPCREACSPRPGLPWSVPHRAPAGTSGHDGFGRTAGQRRRPGCHPGNRPPSGRCPGGQRRVQPRGRLTQPPHATIPSAPVFPGRRGVA